MADIRIRTPTTASSLVHLDLLGHLDWQGNATIPGVGHLAQSRRDLANRGVHLVECTNQQAVLDFYTSVPAVQ